MYVPSFTGSMPGSVDDGTISVLGHCLLPLKVMRSCTGSRKIDRDVLIEIYLSKEIVNLVSLIEANPLQLFPPVLVLTQEERERYLEALRMQIEADEKFAEKAEKYLDLLGRTLAMEEEDAKQYVVSSPNSLLFVICFSSMRLLYIGVVQ